MIKAGHVRARLVAIDARETQAGAPVEVRTLDATRYLDGAANADLCWSGDFTVAPNSQRVLQLADGTLTGVFGDPVGFEGVSAVLVVAARSNVADVIVGGGADPMTGPFGAGSHTLRVKPGGVLMLTAGASAWVLAEGATSLRFANAGQTTAVGVSVFLLGTDMVAGEAAGVVLTAIASLIAGAASAGASASDARITLSGDVRVTTVGDTRVVQSAAGGASAAGVTLSVTASLIAGTATGSGSDTRITLAGDIRVTLVGDTRVTLGAAATAPGTTVTATASLITGSATGPTPNFRVSLSGDARVTLTGDSRVTL